MLDAEYLDRHAIERIFGVHERRARQLMAGLEIIKVGNAVAIRRTSLVERLESDSFQEAKSSGLKNARDLAATATDANPKLPPGVHLQSGELPVRFATDAELVTKLSAVCAVITADSDACAVDAHIAPPPVETAQPTQQRLPAAPRRNRTAVELVNEPVGPAPGAVNAGGDSRTKDRLATPAVDRPTRAHEAEAESPRHGSLEGRYEEFCVAKVKDHLRALPQAVRSQRFEETRSAIRRAAPQLRRNELDEIALRELELKIRAGLHLPSIEEFTARSL